ncbi:MAG TPA: hypothetical protein VF593_11280 [Chthoniobacteraceae bacterium]|jgi:hypothetical protein
MEWLLKQLLRLLIGANSTQANDRSVVGKSRLDEECERSWDCFLIGLMAFAGIALAIWLLVLR